MGTFVSRYYQSQAAALGIKPLVPLLSASQSENEFYERSREEEEGWKQDSTELF